MDSFILICGIGRSGTSLVAKILDGLGYKFNNVNKSKESINNKVLQDILKVYLLKKV